MIDAMRSLHKVGWLLTPEQTKRELAKMLRKRRTKLERRIHKLRRQIADAENELKQLGK